MVPHKRKEGVKIGLTSKLLLTTLNQQGLYTTPNIPWEGLLWPGFMWGISNQNTTHTIQISLSCQVKLMKCCFFTINFNEMAKLH